MKPIAKQYTINWCRSDLLVNKVINGYLQQVSLGAEVVSQLRDVVARTAKVALE